MTENASSAVADPEEPPVQKNEAPATREAKAGSFWREVKGFLWVLFAVVLFHSFVAKPFYIPSESMMPALLKGDRLVVSKYPYGWSYVSPTIPNPAAILRSLFLRTGEPWGITLPFMEGRVFGKLPERGDIVIVTPPGQSEDYIKRVIGLPGDTVEVRAGRLFLNGQRVQAERRSPAMIPVDANAPCGFESSGELVETPDGRAFCRLPIIRETLPNGVTYDTIDVGPSPGDDFGPVKVPAGHLFLMGDNRDRSADSRFGLGPPENGLGGPVPWENIGGRAEFITFSLDGTSTLLNPISWFEALRGDRAGTSLRGSKE